MINPSIANTNRINLDQDADNVNDYAYDSSGNTTKDANGRTFVYDAENKQVEVKNASDETIGKYWYDGDGRRVKKRGWINGQWEETIFVYDASSRLVAEYSTILNPTPQVAYLTADHLGSPRINTNELGAVISRHDYRPYGEEVSERTHSQYVGDTIRKQFTGYERDGETDLDFAQARLYHSRLGRFTSRDPINIERQRLTDPQSINLYCYSRNVPTKYSDPDGRQYVDEKGKKVKIEYQYDEEGNVVGIASVGNNAPADLQKLAKLISEKGSPTALKWFVRGDLSKTKINVAIEGVTGRNRPHDKNGPIDGRLGGNTLRTPDYVRENGNRAYREVSIGVAPQDSDFLLTETRKEFGDPDISKEDYMVAEFAHELSHALSTDEISSVRELDKEKEKMTPEQRQDRKAMSDLREKYYDRFEERNAALLVTVLKEIGSNRR